MNWFIVLKDLIWAVFIVWILLDLQESEVLIANRSMLIDHFVSYFRDQVPSVCHILSTDRSNSVLIEQQTGRYI